MALAYPKLTADAREEIACDHFTNALSDPDLALKVKERTPETLDDALRIALRLEAWAKNVKHDRAEEDRPDRPKQKIRAAAKPEGPKLNDYFGPNDRLVKMENEVTRLQDEMKKLTTTATPAAASTLAPVSWNSPMNFSYAGPAYPTPEAQATASAGESPLPPNGPMTGHPRPAFQTPSYHQSQPFLCWACGLPGHLRRNCMRRNSAMPGAPLPNNSTNRGSKKINARKMQDKANMYVKLKLLGKKVPCLVDTGSEVTLVPRDLIKRFRCLEMNPLTCRVFASTNTPIRIDGEVQLPFFLGERCLWTNTLVSEDVEEPMLGIDWLKKYDCVWNFKTGLVCIDGQPTVTFTHRHIKSRQVLVQEYQEIPPRSQKEIIARMTLHSTHEPEEDIMVETNRLKAELYVGRTFLPTRHRPGTQHRNADALSRRPDVDEESDSERRVRVAVSANQPGDEDAPRDEGPGQ